MTGPTSPIHLPPPHPLRGRRIVVTRARAQAGELVRALEALGADVILAPAIRIEPLDDLRPLRGALARLAEYQWIVFTSQNTVRVVFENLTVWGLSARDFAATRVAAIGPATADALAAGGVRVDVLPEGYVAEALVDAIAAQGDPSGARILLPRAETARDALPQGLRALGAQVDVIPVYRTMPGLDDGAALAQDILGGRVDVVTFTSSSTVHEFVRAVGSEAATSSRFAAAVIGPVTAATARQLGLAVVVEADPYTVPALVHALARHFA